MTAGKFIKYLHLWAEFLMTLCYSGETFSNRSVNTWTAPANIPATDAASCHSYPPLQVEMSVLPHGAEPVTRQADLLLILHALVRSQDFVAGAGCVSRTERPPHPFLLALRPLVLLLLAGFAPSAPLDRLGHHLSHLRPSHIRSPVGTVHL